MAPRFPCWRGAYEEDPQLRAEFLGFPELRLYAGFVPSIDGIVALEQRESSGTVISGGSHADRFVMGLLRACAEAVVRRRWDLSRNSQPQVDGRPHLPGAGRRIQAHAS
jgi:hypothetical protein